MREVERIKRITAILEEVWLAAPDQRLGQLLVNVSGKQAGSVEIKMVSGYDFINIPADLYQIEDNEWENRLKEVSEYGFRRN